jgi:hypothetical protein
LAAGAKVRAATPEDQPSDRLAADATGHSGPGIHLKLIGEIPTPAGAVHVIPPSCATLSDSFLKKVRDRGEQTCTLESAQAPDAARRMNSGAEEHLVGVDISEPGQETLIDKQRFDSGSAVSLQPLVKIVFSVLARQGVRTQMGKQVSDRSSRLREPLHTAKEPSVPEVQDDVVFKEEPQMKMPWKGIVLLLGFVGNLLISDEKTPGHSEMEQKNAVSKAQEQILPVSLDSEKFRSR